MKQVVYLYFQNNFEVSRYEESDKGVVYRTSRYLHTGHEDKKQVTKFFRVAEVIHDHVVAGKLAKIVTKAEANKLCRDSGFTYE